MIILINAISIKEGGSLVVLRNLLRQSVYLRQEVFWHVAVDDRICKIPELSLPSVTAHVFHRVDRTSVHLKWWYNRTLPKLIRDIRADVLFSQTNYLPDVKIACPTLLLEQHAGHFSPVFDELMQASLSSLGRWAWRAKKRWVVQSLRRATRITVQTEALAHAIHQEMNLPLGKINVIPHGLGLSVTGSPKKLARDRSWRIGYITKYGVQKNFLTLFRAIATLRETGHDVCLILTLDSQTAHYPKLMAQAEALGIETWIENHGEVDQKQVIDLYDYLDIFAFPSLCESFGLPMVEAMSRGLPLLIADTPGNLEIAGPAALSFGANDAAELASKVISVMSDANVYSQASLASLQRAQTFTWRKAAASTLALLDKIVDENRRGKHGN